MMWARSILKKSKRVTFHFRVVAVDRCYAACSPRITVSENAIYARPRANVCGKCARIISNVKKQVR